MRAEGGLSVAGGWLARSWAVGRWLEDSCRRMVVWLVWLVWCVFGMAYRYRTEPKLRNLGNTYTAKPLNTAYVSASTEPPDYNHVKGCLGNAKRGPTRKRSLSGPDGVFFGAKGAK